MKEHIKNIRYIVLVVTVWAMMVGEVFSMSAYIGDIDHQTHVFVTEDASIELEESFRICR